MWYWEEAWTKGLTRLNIMIHEIKHRATAVQVPESALLNQYMAWQTILQIMSLGRAGWQRNPEKLPRSMRGSWHPTLLGDHGTKRFYNL